MVHSLNSKEIAEIVYINPLNPPVLGDTPKPPVLPRKDISFFSSLLR